MAGENRYTSNTEPYSTPYSIFDAYKSGKFGQPDSDDAKARRNYFIVDALGTAAKNTSQDIAKIASAYSGSSFTPDYQSSLWDERNKSMIGAGVDAEKRTVAGSSGNIEGEQAGQSTTRATYQMKPAELFSADAEAIQKQLKANPNSPNAEALRTEARLLQLLAASSAGSDLGPEEYIAAAAASNPEINKLITSLAQMASDGVSGINFVNDTVRNAVSSVLAGNETAPVNVVDRSGGMVPVGSKWYDRSPEDTLNRKKAETTKSLEAAQKKLKKNSEQIASLKAANKKLMSRKDYASSGVTMDSNLRDIARLSNENEELKQQIKDAEFILQQLKEN